MFALLVIIYPTMHQGGSLVFRHMDVQYTFDSAQAIADAPASSVAFAAFYSDVEHEVSVVQSGYRVTLTYNLYFEDAGEPLAPSFVATYESALKDSFRHLLSDQTFLPKGGSLGFGLRHEYPIDKGRYTKTLDYLEDSLKGSDAVLMKVCKELSLKATIKMIYNEPYEGAVVLYDGHFAQGAYFEGALWSELGERGGKLLYLDPDDTDEELPPFAEVEWATPMKSVGVKEAETAYITYGNEPSMGFAYSSLCVIVEIKEAANRRVPV